MDRAFVLVFPIGNVLYNALSKLYIGIICDRVTAMVARGQGKTGQHTMKTRGVVGRELEEGHSHSKSIRTTMQKYNQQATGNGSGRKAHLEQGRMREYVIMVCR